MATMNGFANLKTISGLCPTAQFAPPANDQYVIQKDSIVYCTGDSIIDVWWEQTNFDGDICKMLIASSTPHVDVSGTIDQSEKNRFGQSNFVKGGTTIKLLGNNLYLHIIEIDEDYP